MQEKIANAGEKFGDDTEAAALDVDKTMQMTSMKELKISTEKRTKEESGRRILEYIKYLIG